MIFAHAEDLRDLGLAHGDVVDIHAGPGRDLRGYTVIEHAIAKGSLAAYYPEANGRCRSRSRSMAWAMPC